MSLHNLLAFLALALLTSPSFASAEIGMINHLMGQVLLKSDSSIKPAKVGQLLKTGDIIETKSNSSVRLIMKDKNIFVVHENTVFELSSYVPASDNENGTADLDLKIGELHSELVQKYSDKNQFKIITPTAVTGVRGTEFQTVVTDEETSVTTFSGVVAIGKRGQNRELINPVNIHKGYHFDLRKGVQTQKPVKIDTNKLLDLRGRSKNMGAHFSRDNSGSQILNKQNNKNPNRSENRNTNRNREEYSGHRGPRPMNRPEHRPNMNPGPQPIRR